MIDDHPNICVRKIISLKQKDLSGRKREFT